MWVLSSVRPAGPMPAAIRGRFEGSGAQRRPQRGQGRTRVATPRRPGRTAEVRRSCRTVRQRGGRSGGSGRVGVRHRAPGLRLARRLTVLPMTPAAAGRGSEPRPHQGLDATVLKPIESIGRTLDAAGLAKLTTVLLQSVDPAGERLSAPPLTRRVVLAMIKRRASAARTPAERWDRTAGTVTVDEARSGPEARSDTMSHCATTHSHDRQLITEGNGDE